jgi:hypothetical protein
MRIAMKEWTCVMMEKKKMKEVEFSMENLNVP